MAWIGPTGSPEFGPNEGVPNRMNDSIMIDPLFWSSAAFFCARASFVDTYLGERSAGGRFGGWSLTLQYMRIMVISTTCRQHRRKDQSVFQSVCVCVCSSFELVCSFNAQSQNLI